MRVLDELVRHVHGLRQAIGTDVDGIVFKVTIVPILVLMMPQKVVEANHHIECVSQTEFPAHQREWPAEVPKHNERRLRISIHVELASRGRIASR